MASPSPRTLDGAVRETDEYAAAFDLEVWKAQQQLRYEAQLRQAKESLEHRLRTQARATEQKKLAELEALRQDLETMGRRLQAAEEALVKRSAQLDAREAAFNAKRVKVAEQHEAYVGRAEERERRTREEAQLTQSSLQARLQEKDRMLLQLQEKVSAAQGEYDLLRRRAARYLTEQTDTDGQRLHEQECALALAHTQLAEAQRCLRDKSAEAERMAEEKAHLQGQVRELTRQVNVLTRKYNQLSETSQTREWEHLRREQAVLEAAKRTHALRGPAQFASDAALERSFPLTTRAAAAEGRSGLYYMIASLKREVSAGLESAAKKTPGDGGVACPLPFKIVERLPTAPSARSTQGRLGGETALTTTSRGEGCWAGASDVLEQTQCGEESAMETSTMSAALSAIQRVLPSSAAGSSSTSHSPGPRVPPSTAAATATSPLQNDVVVDMGDTSMESYYPRAELQSWPHSLLTAGRDDDDDDGGDAHAAAPLPSARAGTLPPLAPEQRGQQHEDDRGMFGSAPVTALSSSRHVSPTPDDFLLARAAPVAEASRTQAARRDMTAFVQQLKMNREKLLETGVYGEQDSVVREMGEKIRMYEAYLAQHP